MKPPAGLSTYPVALLVGGVVDPSLLGDFYEVEALWVDSGARAIAGSEIAQNGAVVRDGPTHS